MEILPGIKPAGLALFMRKKSILVLSDLQLGYEEALNDQGVMLPRKSYEDIRRRLVNIIEKTKPKTVILNGDVKHEFGRISRTEWREVTDLVTFLKGKAEVIIIEGNHDNILMPVLRKIGAKMIGHLKIDEIYFCHGHEVPTDPEFKEAKIIIIGHEHPAIGLREGERVEKYKCFLVGKWRDKTLFVLPSFNTVTEGTDVVEDKLLSPFLQEDISNFKVFVAADTVLDFGIIREIRKRLAKS